MRRGLQNTSPHTRCAVRPLSCALSGAVFLAMACGDPPVPSDPEPPPNIVSGVRINEVVADNEGVYLDEHGEADDYIEIINIGDSVENLAGYVLIDGGGVHSLPEVSLAPGDVQLLWADDSPDQGAFHLPFKVSATGETLQLATSGGVAIDTVELPALEQHQAFMRAPDGDGAFQICGWATPGRANGAECKPPDSVGPTPDASFESFTWPEPWPEPSLPLAIVEAALRPAEFIEILNVSDRAVRLSEYELTLARHEIGEPWPVQGTGAVLVLPDQSLAPGERFVLAIEEEDVAALEEDPEFEGVLTLWSRERAAPLDRVDFMSWPTGSVLARVPERGGAYRLCKNATPGEPNDGCRALASRQVGDRVRRLLTPGDFHALAEGRSALGTDSVEYLIDVSGGNVVTFLNSANYDLHYTFVREAIEKLPRLDRCDPIQRQMFMAGWWAFSEQEYFKVEGRRYLLGTLVRHAGTGMLTLQFAPGDVISAEQMRHAFLTVMRNVPEPTEWTIRPQSNDQVDRIRAIEGEVPIVAPNAPFRGVTFQPLTAAIAYGTLRFVRAADLRSSSLGPRDIVLTDQVPNDIPLIGGLITEAFQTPLAHVNVLSRGRGTPNMALADARRDPRIEPFLGKLVRLEVTGADFSLREAEPAEALEFWESRQPSGTPLSARLDLEPRGVQPLSERSLADLPSIGGKAAQFAELARVQFCAMGQVVVPERAFAIPVVHSIEHFDASGARAVLDELRGDPAFLADASVRERGLADVRAMILAHPIDAELVGSVVQEIEARWPGQPVRFRSSSNAEDLPGFSGAGLYDSVGLDADDVADAADALREVWASLWNARAYDERDYYNVDHDALGMAVLVHPAFRSERVNGVAISRDVLEPTRGDRQYFNVQVGEALVTNPAPGVESEQFTYQRGGYVPFVYHERSSFSRDKPVISADETSVVACNLEAIERHFRPLIDPDQQNPWFAVDIEFKLMGAERQLVIKQARPYSFGREAPSNWCDF